MLYLLLLIGGLIVGFICHARRHFTKLVPPCRVDEQHGPLQMRRYPKLTVAEVRVSGSTALALRTGTHLLNKYFRDEQIARFALPLLAEKVDAADSIWTMSVVLPMPLEQAPAPKNKAIQLREQPPMRVFTASNWRQHAPRAKRTLASKEGLEALRPLREGLVAVPQPEAS